MNQSRGSSGAGGVYPLRRDVTPLGGSCDGVIAANWLNCGQRDIWGGGMYGGEREIEHGQTYIPILAVQDILILRT